MHPCNHYIVTCQRHHLRRNFLANNVELRFPKPLPDEGVDIAQEEDHGIDVGWMLKAADEKPIPAQRERRGRGRNVHNVRDDCDRFARQPPFEQLLFDFAYHPGLVGLLDQPVLDFFSLLCLCQRAGIAR